jgi:starch synthase (maltosyl-transferring)
MNDAARSHVRNALAPFAVVEDVTPAIDGGRFAVKRVVGEEVRVEAACFAHGHEKVACVVRFRGPGEDAWREVPMEALGNDRWQASFTVDRVGPWQYGVVCWIDHLAVWREEFERRVDPQDMKVAGVVGAELVAASAAQSSGTVREQLIGWARRLREESQPQALRLLAMDDTMLELARIHAPRHGATQSNTYPAWVDRARARFSTWYETFPRSLGEAGRHGTFRDVERHLERIAAMGFDVLYLPPIHPVGQTNRKGRNNATEAQVDDVGSPWGIGAAQGGHTAVHPELGTLDDFRHLVEAAKAKGLEIAMDIAFQATPDHPWVREHPAWFRKRPDGTIQYAENPPKKYQDIYPIDFETTDWRALWVALRDVFLFWLRQGVEIFRVDNPHTKPVVFWEWVIAEVHRESPNVIFLSEAFTRPRVMHRLAKAGFTQSYTYFTWRTTREEIVEYFTELTRGPGVEYLRPNVWPNTPDILPYHLQNAGLPMFRLRYVLAATLAASYGIYGPAFELGENHPYKAGSEEYFGSEKYELKTWDLDRPGNLVPLITTVNRLRHEHPALQTNATLAFHGTDNPALVAYSKRAGADLILVVVNLDPHHVQSGWVHLDPAELGLSPDVNFRVEDRLTGEAYPWRGASNFVMLDPYRQPAHIFIVRR